ncbi:MAG: cytochrome c biogenesis protein ResB [Planctomycetes bacterium]|nr:cytochrome c biogenesis protein ResB [Planctomycetota bacterium]
MNRSFLEGDSPAEAGSERQAKAGNGTSPGVVGSIVGVVAVTLGLSAIGRGWTAAGGLDGIPGWALPVIIALAGTVLWVGRGFVWRWLTSLPFSVAILAVLAVGTALGTFILQGQPDAMLVKKYGAKLARAFDKLGLTDIFHSFTFRGLMAILAVSLGLTIVKRRAWRFSEWGLLLAHGGVIVILIGGLAGALWGRKGFIGLREGETAKHIWLRDALGRQTEEKLELDFGIRLDKFEIDRYPTEYKVYVYRDEKYRPGREKEAGHNHEEDHEYRVVSSYAIKDALKWNAVAKTGKEFRLLMAYPDFHWKAELKEVPEGAGVPALQLRAYDRSGRSMPVTLLAGVPGRDGVSLGHGKTIVRFVWAFDPATAPSPETRPEKHTITFKNGEIKEEIEVKVGETYKIAGGEYELKMLAFIPDFVVDKNAKYRGGSRSPQPNNPAARISIKKVAGGEEEEDWLYAKLPEYHATHGKSDGALAHLVYGYSPEIKPAPRELIVVGKDGEVLDYRNGVPGGKRPLRFGEDEGDAIGPDLFAVKLWPSAEEEHKAITRSNEWRRPVAEVEVKTGGGTRRDYAAPGSPVDLEDGYTLVFDKKDDIKAYRSKVSVMEGDKAVRQAEISVNHPLAQGGYWFYQSDFSKKDPTYSGFLVVKDPGLATVYVGFVMICVGVILAFYVRPWILRRRGARP